MDSLQLPWFELKEKRNILKRVENDAACMKCIVTRPFREIIGPMDGFMAVPELRAYFSVFRFVIPFKCRIR